MMAEEHGSGGSGPSVEGNGGPVRPGAEPPTDLAPGSPGTNGNAGGTGRDLAPSDGNPPGSVIAKESTRRAVTEVGRSRASGLWVALTCSAVVLLFLLIFILQNNVPTEIRFLGLAGTLPVGIALLFAATLGILLVAIPGYLRILQLRRAARKRGVS
jgi:uncharacterized integral membrane protein